jgi:hypothetical protein
MLASLQVGREVSQEVGMLDGERNITDDEMADY